MLIVETPRNDRGFSSRIFMLRTCSSHEKIVRVLLTVFGTSDINPQLRIRVILNKFIFPSMVACVHYIHDSYWMQKLHPSMSACPFPINDAADRVNFFLLWTAWSASSFITNTDNRCLSPIEVRLHFAYRSTCHSKRHVRGSGPLLDPHTNQKKSFCVLARNSFGHDRNQTWRSTNRGSLLLLDLDP